jgi:hypothetical protein
MKEYFVKNIDNVASICKREGEAINVIGRVSEKAKWVKEGMEFSEEDLIAQPAAACITKPIKKWHPSHLIDVTVKVKCPECGVFR